MSDQLNSLENAEALASHLESVLRALYESLGQLAPTLSDDAMVLAVFEMARILGDGAHRFSELGAHRNGVTPLAPRPVTVIDEVLRRSTQVDESGALTLYCVSSLIGPRLLISLRDASSVANGPGDGALRQAVHDVAAIVLGQIQRIGELGREKTESSEPSALEHARELDEMLTGAHFAESFGLYP